MATVCVCVRADPQLWYVWLQCVTGRCASERTVFLSVDDIEHSVRYPSLLGQLHQHHAGTRVLLTGLHHVCVATHQCHREHLRREEEGGEGEGGRGGREGRGGVS